MKYIMILLIPCVLLAQIAEWVYTYDGNMNNYDVAYAIVSGSDGNIYAAGRSMNFGASSDFTVVSLTQNGLTNWVYEYHNLEDFALSIAYGLDNNIYKPFPHKQSNARKHCILSSFYLISSCFLHRHQDKRSS